jgi:hypothetical protein
LVAWQERLYDCAQWLAAGLLLPLAMETCACGKQVGWVVPPEPIATGSTGFASWWPALGESSFYRAVTRGLVEGAARAGVDLVAQDSHYSPEVALANAKRLLAYSCCQKP